MLLAALTASFLLAPDTDEIELVNGKILTVERVTEETYSEVKYKTLGGGDGRKPAEEVRGITHDTSSPLLDDYVVAITLMEAGDFAGAIGAFTSVLEDRRLMGNARYRWVKPHTYYRAAQCAYSLADFGQAADTVNRLISEVPDTFFYAPALLLKAEALEASGDRNGAERVFSDLAAAVKSKGLPEQWDRAAELGRVLLDTALKGTVKQQRLQQLVEKNRDKYPTVASRARVEIGNAMVADNDFQSAEAFFQGIVDEGKADDRTIAAAHMGLGDCAFQRGLTFEDPTKEEARETMETAILSYLRVATIYKGEISLVPRSLARAAISLDRMGDRPSALKIAGRLDRAYPGSRWNQECKEKLRLR